MKYLAANHMDLNLEQTRVVPLNREESEIQISLSPRFHQEDITNTLDESRHLESSGIRDLKLTGRNVGKHHNTMDDYDGKHNRSKRVTGKVIKKIKLQENFMNSNRKRYGNFRVTKVV